MTNQIQPYSMIKKTNIKEHNDMINKINEIVDVINNVNLDTINTEITNIKNKDSAQDTEIANIKNKDTTQDTEIDGITKSLVSNVTASFDNPSRELRISLGREASPSIDATVVIPASSETGQYSAGNGITIENYQIAVDTGVVALKTDIPVVPDVSEITNRLDTIDGEITGINTDITNITNKNTEQDTAINGKVGIAQGTENAGKVLGIGADGNVTPVNAGGSSTEIWDEITINNWPTDWNVNDKIKIEFIKRFNISNPTNWTTEIIEQPFTWSNSSGITIEDIVITLGNGDSIYKPIGSYFTNTYAEFIVLSYWRSPGTFNANTDTLFSISINAFNGVSSRTFNYQAKGTDIGDYYKLYRLRR